MTNLFTPVLVKRIWFILCFVLAIFVPKLILISFKSLAMQFMLSNLGSLLYWTLLLSPVLFVFLTILLYHYYFHSVDNSIVLTILVMSFVMVGILNILSFVFIIVFGCGLPVSVVLYVVHEPHAEIFDYAFVNGVWSMPYCWIHPAYINIVPQLVMTRYAPVACTMVPTVSAPYIPRTGLGYYVFNKSTSTVLDKVFTKNDIPKELQVMIKEEIKNTWQEV